MTEQDGQSAEIAPMSKDEKMWAMLCHLSALAGFVVPFGNIIAPLVIWILKKEEYPLVDDQGKEALNFQISVTIYLIIGVILIFVAIGIVVLPLVALFSLIMIIVASIKANDGAKYRYPLTIRLID
jgi:uncharacterized Tic20 family protein